MKLITEEEYKELLLKARGRGRVSAGYVAISNLKIGEILKIDKAEWKQKDSPLRVAMRIEKKHKLKYQKNTLTDGSGWVVKRVG